MPNKPSKRSHKKKVMPSAEPSIPEITPDPLAVATAEAKPEKRSHKKQVVPKPTIEDKMVKVEVAMGKVSFEGVVSKKGDVIEIPESIFNGCDRQYKLV